VFELHTLLNRAGERAPFMLVGHSYGGRLVRLYQSIYPGEIAGMVLIDAAEDDPLRMTNDGRVVRSSSLVASRPIPPVKTTGPLKLADIPAQALTQIRAGLADSVRHANESPRDKLPQEAQRMRSWALGQVGHTIAAVNPFELEELAALRAQRAATPFPLGDLPLVVIARGLPDETGPDAAAHEREHKDDQAALAALSRHGKQITAERSGHHVQLDQPQLVVSAIQEVVAAAAK
jgi:pimeloyl-ACP methyl ester carboxylesterase